MTKRGGARSKTLAVSSGRRPIGILFALLALVSSVPVGQFLWIALRRAGYPFELEWLKGDMFHHALRIRDGLAWYPRPSIEFFPEFYPPGYVALCAALMHPFGASLWVMRVVSIFSTVLAGCIIVLLARGITGSVLAGIAGAGLLFASFGACGSWFDLARVDSLAIALTLAGTYLAGRDSRASSFYLGIAALVLATCVKQNHLAFLAATIAVWFAWERKRALIALAVAAVTLGAIFAVLEATSGGWFSFYVFDLPSAARIVGERVRSFGTDGVLRLGGLALAAVAWAYATAARASLPILMLPVAAVVSLSGWSQTGGYLNNLIPFAVYLAAATGIGLGELMRHPPRWRALAPLITLLVLGQMLFLAGEDWTSSVPSRDDVANGWKVVEEVRALPEPTLAPYHPYLLHLAGRPMQMQFHMFNELESAQKNGARLDDGGLRLQIERALAEGRWTTYISIQGARGEIRTPIDDMALRNEAPSRPLIPETDGRTLVPLTGNRVRPGRAYLLRDPVQ